MAPVRVVGSREGHRLVGDGPVVGAGNRFLEHLGLRAFSPATVRAYAFDLANFAGFLADRSLDLVAVAPTDLFDYLDWQSRQVPSGGKVVALRRRGPAPATMNRRVAAVRGLFEHLVMLGERADNPVPAARRASGLRGQRNGLLGHVAVRPRSGGRLIREPKRLPESLPAEDVTALFADLDSRRDRAMVLAMVLGGLRAAEVRSLRLADVDMGLRRVRVVGKGDKERVVPIDDVFFTECAAYLRSERPRGCRTPECFVVLRGPTQGRAMSEAGMRKVFRTHRARSGAMRGCAPIDSVTPTGPSWPPPESTCSLCAS
jgi:integrase/recombinase XerC